MTTTEEIHERAHDAPAAPSSLARKLLEAAQAVGVIEKDKRNAFHNYDYASIEAIAAATGEALLSRGVLLLAGEDETSDRQRQTNQGEATVTTVRLTFRFLDVETGESLSIPWVGRGEDPADKGVSKALTDARKTFLIQQLNLVRGEDTEADPRTDERSYSPPGGGGGGGRGSVNLAESAKGLTNAQLNAALVSAGLPAAEKPWNAFMRVAPEHVMALREALDRERSG
jgi:hypothetical protein